MSSIDPALTADPEIDAAVARAERRRGKLERLSDIGMDLAEQVGAHAAAAMAAVNETKGGDPCRSFAAVSRAVRMMLALETRIDQQILALRNLQARSPGRSITVRPPAAPLKPAVTPVSAIPLGPDAVRVRDAVWSAIDAERDAFDGAMEALDELHERLTDREPQDGVSARSFRDKVKAICADLGLAPDWNGWSDETGFAVDPDKPRVKWHMLWAYDARRAEQRRRREAERMASAGAGPPPDS